MGRGKQARGRRLGRQVDLKERTPKVLGRGSSGAEALVERLRREREGPPPKPRTPEELAAERREWERSFALAQIGRHPARNLRYRSGQLLFQRLGHLNAVRQDRGFAVERAPEARGVWAFPWPTGDIAFFASHKWDEVLPKKLRRQAWAELDELYAAAVAAEDEFEKERLQAEFERYHEERSRWIREVGPKVLPLRRFWYGGELYSRLDRHGEPLPYTGDSSSRWTRLTVSEYLEACRKSPVGYGTDHLEVFIPGSVS